MSDDKVCVSVRLPKDLNDSIEDHLDYGDSKDGWIRETVRWRLNHEDEQHD